MSPDLPLVVGTAGHVDHGKTTLIHALTGIDTDRLDEEKRRGLTIDLGFAPFVLPSGRLASVVDVPGHERFLKNMLAGAPGMDLVILVVAADDGVMPQTREHLAILQLLHAQKGVVAVTKADLVEPDLLELALEDIRDALQGTFLEGAPLVPVSAPNGQGLPDLLTAIDRVAGETSPRRADGPFRMPIDRVFVKQGFGTVVTGTLFAGTLREGEAVEILPADARSRIRGLQVHGGKRESVVAGQRVAVNLAGIERADLGRGDWLVPSGAFQPSLIVDVDMELLRGVTPLEHRTRIRVHHGTAEVIGRVALLDRDVLQPGERASAQLLLEAPLLADHQDRMIIRRYAPMETLGGATVLAPVARRHRRRETRVLERLRLAREGRWSEVLEAVLLEAARPVPRAELLLALPFERREEAFAELLARGKLRETGSGVMHAEANSKLHAQILEAVDAHHAKQAWRLGPTLDVLHAQTHISLPLLRLALDELVELGELRRLGRAFERRGRERKLPAPIRSTRDAILARLEELRFAEDAALVEGLPAADKVQALMEDLVEEGFAVRFSAGLYAAPKAVSEAKEMLARHFPEGFTASQAREKLGTNRKLAIPFLEYLDSQGFTKRQGDLRVLTVALA